MSSNFRVVSRASTSGIDFFKVVTLERSKKMNRLFLKGIRKKFVKSCKGHLSVLYGQEKFVPFLTKLFTHINLNGILNFGRRRMVMRPQKWGKIRLYKVIFF